MARVGPSHHNLLGGTGWAGRGQGRPVACSSLSAEMAALPGCQAAPMCGRPPHPCSGPAHPSRTTRRPKYSVAASVPMMITRSGRPFVGRAGRGCQQVAATQGWQGRWGALTSAPRPAPPGKISAPRPTPPSAPAALLECRARACPVHHGL